MEEITGLVKMDDVLELVKLVHRIHTETNHYASIEFCNTGYEVFVAAMKDGFVEGKEYSLFQGFCIYDSRNHAIDSLKYRQTRDYLRELLGEKYG